MAFTNAVNATTAGIQSITSAGVWNGRTLTAGAGISIANGDGTAGNPTITALGAGVTWNLASASVANMAVGNGYFAVSPGGALTFGLPATAVLGDTIELSLDGATSWQITQAAGQFIRVGNTLTSVGVGGSITSTAAGDSIYLVCRAAGASTGWVAQATMGNLTIV